MKLISFLISSMILFNSCTRNEGLNSLPNQPRSTAVNTTPDALGGREFVSDSLEWIDNDFGYPSFYLVDSNLLMPGRHLSVAIKHDTSCVWEQANMYSGGQGSWGYNVFIGVLAVGQILPNLH
jgi:hypothetical protein